MIKELLCSDLQKSRISRLW